MRLDEAIKEWQSKQRRMGCVAATDWLCRRVEGFSPIRYALYNEQGEYSEHVVATNGRIEVDLAPYARVLED